MSDCLACGDSLNHGDLVAPTAVQKHDELADLLREEPYLVNTLEVAVTRLRIGLSDLLYRVHPFRLLLKQSEDHDIEELNEK